MANGRLFRPTAESALRNPTSNAQMNGNILNPPRYPGLGGLTSPGKAASRNAMTIVPPGAGTRREPISGG